MTRNYIQAVNAGDIPAILDANSIVDTSLWRVQVKSGHTEDRINTYIDLGIVKIDDLPGLLDLGDYDDYMVFEGCNSTCKRVIGKNIEIDIGAYELYDLRYYTP